MANLGINPLNLRHWICDCKDAKIHSEEIEKCPLCGTKRPTLIKGQEKICVDCGIEISRGAKFRCSDCYIAHASGQQRVCARCGQPKELNGSTRCMKCVNDRKELQRRAFELRNKATPSEDEVAGNL